MPSFSRVNSEPQGSLRDVVLRGEDPRPAKENTPYHAIKQTRFSVAEEMVRSSVPAVLSGRAISGRCGRCQALRVLLQHRRFSTQIREER